MRNRYIVAALAMVTATAIAQEHKEMAYVASTAQVKLETIGKKGVVSLEVKNPNASEYKDAPVCVKLPEVFKYKSASVSVNGQEIPSQLDDLNGDGVADELSLVIDLAANESKDIHISNVELYLPEGREPFTSEYAENVSIEGLKVNGEEVK